MPHTAYMESASSAWRWAKVGVLNPTGEQAAAHKLQLGGSGWFSRCFAVEFRQATVAGDLAIFEEN